MQNFRPTKGIRVGVIKSAWTITPILNTL